MKSKFLGILLLLTVGTASAHWHGHGGGGCCYRSYGGWVAPALIGGVIGYELSRPNIIMQPPVILQQPQIVVQPPALVIQQNCTPWTETQNLDGTITRTRTCTQ